jgi:hypothetical protein
MIKILCSVRAQGLARHPVSLVHNPTIPLDALETKRNTIGSNVVNEELTG